MTMHAGLVAGAAVLGLAGVFAAGAWQIDGAGGYSGLSPRFLPSLVAAGLGVCGVLLLIEAIAARKAGPVPDLSTTPSPGGTRRDLAWVVCGLIVHLVSISSVGFILASTLLWVCVARGYGSTRPGRDALIALAVSGFVWVMFTQAVGLGLPLCPMLGL